jgi:hypothetical protein
VEATTVLWVWLDRPGGRDGHRGRKPQKVSQGQKSLLLTEKQFENICDITVHNALVCLVAAEL